MFELFSSSHLLETLRDIGYIGIVLIVFAESGLFFGFFLPGDSLLFSAGLLASQGFFDLSTLIVFTSAAAIAGDNVGFLFGQSVGPRIFTRHDSLLFSKEHIRRARDFYEVHGPKALVLARFVPIVRTFVPIVAGVGSMRYGLFIRYNIVGGIGWCAILSSLGFFLGTSISDIDSYLLPIVSLIILVSFLPVIVEVVKARRKRRM